MDAVLGSGVAGVLMAAVGVVVLRLLRRKKRLRKRSKKPEPVQQPAT